MDYEAVQVFVPGLRQITEEFSSKSIVAAVTSRDVMRGCLLISFQPPLSPNLGGIVDTHGQARGTS
jgi:hypothetical protein